MKSSGTKRKIASLILFVLPVWLCVGVFNSVSVSGKTKCGPTPFGTQCTSEVDFATFGQTAFQTQHKEQWCWAAAISMLFSYYGHPVSQEKIVSSLYGTTVNLPSGPGWNIASRLNADWLDDRNQKFSARLTAAYDFDARVITLNNAWLVNELHEDRPFIIGTNGHAVVATAIVYFPTPVGPNVTGIGVFDPWPGRGARNLSPGEMVPMHMMPPGQLRFLATVRVFD